MRVVVRASSTGSGWWRREGATHSQAIKTQLTKGTKNKRQSQGERRASSRRRSVIETPIQRKGSAQAAISSQSHSGAAPIRSARTLRKGFR